ncbi:hypothetical protein Lalb_Chr01g0000801 [Lupinus albus]|uniref:Uncharacterized protein n=1 Tax=Lupinus albus TaxID=3870 RepID=A0A6A4R4G6_LUPAL|nr:hypothetical protein Lalb_Chr01g0000801 [Lupinus albus]
MMRVLNPTMMRTVKLLQHLWINLWFLMVPQIFYNQFINSINIIASMVSIINQKCCSIKNPQN